jgi:hypothetical protein
MPTRQPGESHRSRSRRLFRAPSPTLVIAVLALLVSTAGSAFGGSSIRHYPYFNSIDIIDNTITGRDIKNKSLTMADFRGRGPQGAPGARGPAGPAGANGQNGAQGPTGPAGTNGTNGTNGRDGFARLDRNVLQTSAAALAQTGLRVDCDTGLFVVGGGVVSDGLYNQTSVNSSFPSSSASWTGFVDNYTNTSITFRVYVICAPATQVTSVAEERSK